jgi:hypothetical protein
MPEQKSNIRFHNEAIRIRAIFGLATDAPLPHVTVHTLLTYRQYLARHLAFPFQALYEETKPPVRRLVRYITITGLVDTINDLSEGILCTVEGIQPIRQLPLIEVGVREDDPNYPVIDDYAYWLLNWP